MNELKGWELLLIMDKFDQVLDGMDRLAYELKQKISKEAWDKVKDLFYYDSDCEAWLTLKPVEVTRRLVNDEWSLDREVFKRIEAEISENNTYLLYESLQTLRRFGGTKTVNLVRKSVKAVSGSVPEFSRDARIIARESNQKTEKITVEKGGKRYIVFLRWMCSVDDVGFVGLVWREKDVKDCDDSELLNAVDLYVASTVIFARETKTIEEGRVGNKEYLIKRASHHNPIANIHEEYYTVSLWHRANDPYSYDYSIAKHRFLTAEEAKNALTKRIGAKEPMMEGFG